MPAFKKGEKIVDEAVLERLAKARQKALETRQVKAQVKKDNKLLKDLKLKKTQEENEELKEYVKPKSKAPEEATANDVEEEIIEIRKKPKSKSKPKKRILYVSDHETEEDSSDEEVVVKKSKPKLKNLTPSLEGNATSEPIVEKALEPEPIIIKSEREVHLDRMFARCYGNSLH